MRIRCLVIAGVMLVSPPAFAQQVKTGSDTSSRQYLEDASGKTLYVYDNDAKAAVGTNCTGPCTTHWKPFLAEANAQPHGDWTIMQRVDGSGIQWLYKGRPLYAFDGDKAPGQFNGNSFEGNKWHLAQP